MEAYWPLITGLIGALVGSLPAVFVQWMQNRAARKRERMAWVLEAAKTAHATNVEYAKFTKGSTYPLAVDVDYYRMVFDIMDRGKDVPARLSEAGARLQEVKSKFGQPA